MTTTTEPTRTPAAAARAAALALPLSLAALLGGCAPQMTGTTYSPYALGRAASVSYGTVVLARPVQVASGPAAGGIGTAGGALAGGVAGSFIGGDWRSNLLAGLGGAILGGLAGNTLERGAASGSAVEFVVREDGGGDFAVVQTNEEGLQVGDRVVVSRGDRVRLSRAAGGGPAAVGFDGRAAPSAAAAAAYAGPPPGGGRSPHLY